ncbi:response regulator [Candidatus Dojkabacteria bacterium]|nr:response regulator [Candidatus Dojkabacteria bacterium]
MQPEKDAREIYFDLLSTKDTFVDTASNGLEGEEKMKLYKYDLVISDIIMPYKDGVSLLETAMESPSLFNNPKIVMLSNIAGDQAIDKCLEIGAIGYLLKSDVDPVDFKSIVLKFIQEES